MGLNPVEWMLTAPDEEVANYMFVHGFSPEEHSIVDTQRLKYAADEDSCLAHCEDTTDAELGSRFEGTGTASVEGAGTRLRQELEYAGRDVAGEMTGFHRGCQLTGGPGAVEEIVEQEITRLRGTPGFFERKLDVVERDLKEIVTETVAREVGEDAMSAMSGFIDESVVAVVKPIAESPMAQRYDRPLIQAQRRGPAKLTDDLTDSDLEDEIDNIVSEKRANEEFPEGTPSDYELPPEHMQKGWSPSDMAARETPFGEKLPRDDPHRARDDEVWSIQDDPAAREGGNLPETQAALKQAGKDPMAEEGPSARRDWSSPEAFRNWVEKQQRNVADLAANARDALATVNKELNRVGSWIREVPDQLRSRRIFEKIAKLEDQISGVESVRALQERASPDISTVDRASYALATRSVARQLDELTTELSQLRNEVSGGAARKHYSTVKRLEGLKDQLDDLGYAVQSLEQAPEAGRRATFLDAVNKAGLDTQQAPRGIDTEKFFGAADMVAKMMRGRTTGAGILEAVASGRETGMVRTGRNFERIVRDVMGEGKARDVAEREAVAIMRQQGEAAAEGGARLTPQGVRGPATRAQRQLVHDAVKDIIAIGIKNDPNNARLRENPITYALAVLADLDSRMKIASRQQLDDVGGLVPSKLVKESGERAAWRKRREELEDARDRARRAGDREGAAKLARDIAELPPPPRAAGGAGVPARVGEKPTDARKQIEVDERDWEKRRNPEDAINDPEEIRATKHWDEDPELTRRKWEEAEAIRSELGFGTEEGTQKLFDPMGAELRAEIKRRTRVLSEDGEGWDIQRPETWKSVKYTEELADALSDDRNWWDQWQRRDIEGFDNYFESNRDWFRASDEQLTYAKRLTSKMENAAEVYGLRSAAKALNNLRRLEGLAVRKHGRPFVESNGWMSYKIDQLKKAMELEPDTIDPETLEPRKRSNPSENG